MARVTQSRYQAGLPYDPAMVQGSYRPERVTAPQTPPGDYTVTPIPLPTQDGGGVTAPLATEGGSGLGGGIGGVGLLTSLLSPNTLTSLRDGYNRLFGNNQTGDSSTWGSDVIGSPADTTAQELLHQSAMETGAAGDTADKAAGLLGDMGAGSWQEGVLGAGDGSGGLFGYGGFSAFPAGTGAVPWEGALGGLDVGLGSIDLASAGLGMLGGALGTYMVSQAPYEGDRDPTAKNIGSALGAAIGGILGGPVAPITAFLGAQFGGMIGGQFGPQITIGPIAENGMYLTDGNWDIRAGADNGAKADPAFGNAMRDSINALMAARGYEYTPGAQDMWALGWNAGGEGTRAQRGGYYIRPGGSWAAGDSPNSAVYFGNNLNDPYVSYAAQMQQMGGPETGNIAWGWQSYLPTPYGYGADPNLGQNGFPLDMSFLAAPNGMTVGNAMTGYLFNDLAVNGAIRPIGGEAYHVPSVSNVGLTENFGGN